MPPSKKQKTSKDSSAASQTGEAEHPNPHKNHEEKRDPLSIPPHEYVCFYRPQFDFEAENRNAGEDQLEFEELEKKFDEEYEKDKKKNISLKAAKDLPDWKWVIMMDGWKAFCDYNRRAKYCSPDRFGMHIYNDFEGWGLQELIENWIVAFDKAFKKKDDDDTKLKEMWSIISGLGLWVNAVDMGPLYGNEDGEKTKALDELVGHALLATLASIDKAKELNSDSTFIDLAHVMSEFLNWSAEHESYGIDGNAIAWRPHVAEYFKKAKLEPSKGISGTAELLEKLKDDKGETKDSGADPWGWADLLKKYKKSQGPKIGGSQYDITKMTRKERAGYAYDGKDPLKDVSEKDLKAGNLDFA